MQEITEYRRFVDELSRSREPTKVILNRSPEHASVVIEALFRRARQYVHIVSRRLSSDVYATAGVIFAATEFLRRGGTIHLLVENPIDRTDHPLLVALDGVNSELVIFAVVPPEVVQRYRFNLVVADGDSYRFEENRELREAIIRFSDTTFGSQLEATFQHLSRQAIAQP
jgi:hypothetical protein